MMVTSAELYAAAAFLVGEGSFGYYSGRGNGMRLQARQLERAPLEWLHQLFGGCITNPRLTKGFSKKPSAEWVLTGPRAAGLMMTLFPFIRLISPRRTSQVKSALAKWRAAPPSHKAMKEIRLAN